MDKTSPSESLDTDKKKYISILISVIIQKFKRELIDLLNKYFHDVKVRMVLVDDL